MAKIELETVQKPLEERILDAACIFWEVSRELFKMKSKDTDTQKRHILFYMLKEYAELQPTAIAAQFGLHKSSVYEAIETISSTKTIYPTIARSIKEILKIAETLQSQLVVVDIKLQNKTDGLHD